MHSNPPAYCSIGHYGGSPIVCECHIIGPPNTPYSEKKITIEIILYDGYPYNPPEVKIMSNRFWHINIMNQVMGYSRLLHLQQVWKNNWNINTLLQHLVDLLREPQIDYLPDHFQEIYFAWSKEYDKMKSEYSRKGLSKIEDLSKDKSIVEMISKMNRIEQMHLQIIFLYLTNYHSFCEEIQKRLP